MISKVTVVKSGIKFVTFESVKTIVDPAVDMIVPEQTKPHKKILTKIGSYAVSAAITHAITKEVDEIIDNVMSAKEMYDEIKNEAIEAAKKAASEGEE